MKFSDFFKPSWKRSDPGIRLKAVHKITAHEILTVIIKNSNELFEIRKTAVERLNDTTLAESLFYDIYGDMSEEIRTLLLKYITSEQKIQEMYFSVRKKGGLSFLEIVLEQRLFDIWYEKIDATSDNNILLSIAKNARHYPMGSYVSCFTYGIVAKAVGKITDALMLAELLMNEYKQTNAIHYSYRDGLSANTSDTVKTSLMAHIIDIDFLVQCIKYSNSLLTPLAERRLTELGKMLLMEEKTVTRKCSSCHGARGGNARVPYTDRDWAWEECSSCQGTGEETVTQKEYRIVNS